MSCEEYIAELETSLSEVRVLLNTSEENLTLERHRKEWCLGHAAEWNDDVLYYWDEGMGFSVKVTNNNIDAAIDEAMGGRT